MKKTIIWFLVLIFSIGFVHADAEDFTEAKKLIDAKTPCSSLNEKQLEIIGIGFKAEVKIDVLVLNVGYSHQVNYKIPKGIEIKVEKSIITVSGADKQLVGQTAAEIRDIKKPEPYKGKGIKYVDEIIRRKAGKAVVKSE